MLFAASYPERTRALLLVGGEVKEAITDDWPWGESTAEQTEDFLAALPERWGSTGCAPSTYAPSLGASEAERAYERSKRLIREASSPGPAVAFIRMAREIDVRDVCSSITVPTLVVHRLGDRVCHVENGRFLARSIPGARYLELAGDDHVPWLNPAGADEIAAEIQEFLTGVREAPQPDRALATVLFTDLVGSTEKLAELGDLRWRHCSQHHAAVRVSSTGSAAVRSTPRATASSPPSTARRVRSAAPRRSATPATGSRSASGLHTGEFELIGTKSAGSLSTSGRAWLPWPGPARCSSPPPCGPRRRLGDRVRGPRPARAQGPRRAAPALRGRLASLRTVRS